MKRIVSIIISAVMLISTFALSSQSAFAASAEITYSYKYPAAGFAEGTITLTAPAGTYWLYWADGTKALDGYYQLAKLTLSSQGSKTHRMYERSVIPVGAENLIAIQSTSEPASKTVANASAVYSIPVSKRLAHNTSDLKYRFASYSDVHIDGVKKTYKYDEVHLSKALDTAAARDAEFIVMSGDYVNNNIDYPNISIAEWRTYQRVLADSDYCNPVYEAIGNHELWQNVSGGTADFIKGTGLEGSNGTAKKAYFEKTLGGDHFIFMAMEGGFYPDKTEEFTDEQLDWLSALLKKYSGDGKNIYIIEHSLFESYGAGDRPNDPYYDIQLTDKQESSRRFKSLLNQYKDAIFLSGHTHIAFAEQYNYSDNNGTSAQMIHNSSVGGVRRVEGNGLNRDYKEDDTEGYIVDVYNDAIIFNGAALYYNKYDPNCCYLVKPSARILAKQSGTEPVTETTAPTTVTETETETQTPEPTETATATETATSTQTETETITDSATQTETVTQTAEVTETETVTETEPKLLGDVNLDNTVNIKDATLVQKASAKLAALTEEQKFLADVNFDTNVNVKDATLIQKLIAKLIESFEAESKRLSTGADVKTEVKENLNKYYRYSSYDCYQALKKAYSTAADTAVLTTLNAELLKVVDPANIDAEGGNTVYFENTNNWSSVYVYNWGNGGVGSAKAWPGEKLASIGKNEYNHSIYKYTITNSKFPWVIFSNGSESTKTADIRVYDSGYAYYLSGSSSPFEVKSYLFKDKYIVS